MADFEPQRFGAYVLTAHLGRGGMATVYRAQRVGAAGFERTVVVKRILDTHTADQNFVKMFINEAKLAARLTHPNIVQVHELGEIRGEYFMSMEYVHGRDLLKLLRALAGSKNGGAMPPRVAAYIARETCRALAHAHANTDEKGSSRPIVHRDVSPQNIMISYDGQVKLVDFGIAKALNSISKSETRTGSLKGKFAYMAPEQIKGVSPGPQTDIFSLGVVLHEMLTGRRLFKGATDYETLSKIKSMPIHTPSSVVSTVPAELDAIVLKALDRDRAKRFSSASAMARELDQFLSVALFSIEDMAGFMAELFPVAERDQPISLKGMPPPLDSEKMSIIVASPSTEIETTPGKLIKLPDVTPAAATGSVTPEASTPTPKRDSFSQTEIVSSLQTPGPRGLPRRRRVVFGSAIVVGGLALAILAAYRIGGTQHEELVMASPIKPPPTPAPQPIAELPAAAPKAPIAAPPVAAPSVAAPQTDAPHAVAVELRSEPAGAQVYSGPKVLGATPLSVQVPPDGLQLTLERPGFEPLKYHLKPDEGREVTLRLSARHEARVRTREPSPAHTGKPRIQPLEDEPKLRRPRVESLDD